MLMKAKKETNETTRALQTNARKVRHLGRIYMHAFTSDPEYASDPREGHATITFEESGNARATVRTTVEVPCAIYRGHTDARVTRPMNGCGGATTTEYTDDYHPSQGYESFNVETFASAVALLPSHASVRIEVRLDGGSNEICAESLVHADRIYLTAEWQERGATARAKFLIDASVSRHNSARFGSPRG